MLERSLSDLVDQLCGNIGLHPDWRRIAAEPWAVKELQSGQAWAPLQAAAADAVLARPLPLAGEGDPDRGGEGIPPPLPTDEHARLKFLIASLDALERTAEEAIAPPSAKPADLFPAPA